tara:strand:- start:168 stop:392 length:225 start_codon:yes stop_codon:yes gene_type:complete
MVIGQMAKIIGQADEQIVVQEAGAAKLASNWRFVVKGTTSITGAFGERADEVRAEIAEIQTRLERPIIIAPQQR